MKFEITKEQILEIFEATSIANAEQLRQWFPLAFETKLEVGRWYKGENGTLFFAKRKDDDFIYGFGFTESRTYYEYFQEYIKTKIEPATDSEVEAALIAEAKKRGFKEGVYYEPISEIGELKIKHHRVGSKFSFYTGKNGIEKISNGIQYIFKQGKWAEIIPTMTKQEAEEKLNVKIVG